MKEHGYGFIQYSGIPLNVSWCKRELNEVGLPILLTHVPMGRILDDTEKLIEEHKEIGCYNIGLGGLFIGIKNFKTYVDKLEVAAKKIESAGLKLFYHNHMHEFMKDENGKIYFDYLIDNAPHVNFTLDTYWVERGGVDIYGLLEKIKGRVDCVHFKDYSVIEKSKDNDFLYENAECPCGEGNLDFVKMMPYFKSAGSKYFFVEQDNAAEKDDAMKEVEKSIIYLNKIF